MVRGSESSTFKTLIISFMVVFLVPVVVAVLFYSRIEKIMIDNANRSHMAALEQARQMIDNNIGEIDRLAMQIGFSLDLKRFMDRNDYDDPEELYRLISFLKELSLYNSLNPIIGHYYIYLHNTDMIISPSLKVDSKTFYNRMLSYEDMSYEQYVKTFLTAPQFGRYYPLHPMRSGTINPIYSNKMTYVHSLPFGEKENIKATFVVLIDELKFSELFGDIPYAEHSRFTIVGRDGQVLLQQSAGENPAQQAENEAILALDPTNYVTSQTVSGSSGWTFVLSVPKEIVLSQVNEVKGHALWLFFGCFVLGTIVCYCLAITNYSPVRRLMNVVSELSDQKEKLKMTIHSYLPVVRSDYLSRLIRGRVHSHSLNYQELEKMNVQLPYEDFTVIVVEIDDCSKFIKEDSEQEWGLVRFIVGHSAVEMFKEYVYPIELDRHRVAVLINTVGDNDNKQDEIQVVLKQWKSFLEKRLRTYITIGISDTHKGVEKISQCYFEADNALDYKLIQGEGSIIYYNEVREWGTLAYYFPVELEVQLINVAKMSDVAGVERLLEQIYEVNFVRQPIVPEMSRQLFADLISCLNKLAASLSIVSDEMNNQWISAAQAYDGCSSTEEMMARTTALYIRLCEELAETRTASAKRVYTRIKEYIDEHYMENSISLNAISEHLNMSPSYLSVSFKKQSGQTISDYILRARIDYAKALLADHTLTTSVVAERIGYANNIGFIRAFKKLEGITPGQYRQSLT